jgi:hypothetical protein
MALHLAGCAGFMDAVAFFKPEVTSDPSFVRGDRYFEKAKSHRERPPLHALEAERLESRDYWYEALISGAGHGGSMLPHSMIACDQALREELAK